MDATQAPGGGQFAQPAFSVFPTNDYWLDTVLTGPKQFPQQLGVEPDDSI